MRKNLAVAALLLAGGAAARSPAQPAQSPMQSAAQGSLRYTAELGELREFAQRLELRVPGWRLLALERSAGLEPARLAFGLVSPWGALGPLAPRGLLRELADPLGCSPGSEVFSEPTGFRLEGSLQAASRRGLWLEPLPGRLGLFALRKPPESAEAWGAGLFGGGSLGWVQAGGTAALRVPESGPARAEVQALALLSRPPPGSAAASADWLRECSPFPGGSLAHWGGRLRLEAAGWQPGRLACGLSAAASGGRRVPAGFFGLGTLEAAGRHWGAQGLLGGCTPGYRTPEGEAYPGVWEAGIGLEVRPRPEWRLTGSWRRTAERPPPIPDRSLPGSEECRFAARLRLPWPAGIRLEAKAQARARVRYAANGRVEPAAAVGLEAGLHGKQGGFGLELRGSREEGSGELRGLLRGQHGGVRVEAGVVGRTAGSFSARPFGRLELSGKDFLFWLSVGGGDSGEEVSLGWSAVQALSASPTSRISRSRR